MPKIKKPEEYKIPLRARSDIVEWIIDNTDQRTYHYTPYYLCFDVKCYNFDNSYETMWKRWKESGYSQEGEESPEWQQEARERYDNYEHLLFDWGLESARESFLDSCCFRMLWNDKSRRDIELEFVGRSGGWAAVTFFEGWPFDHRLSGRYLSETDLRIQLEEEMPYQDLRDLYAYVRMLKHDLREEAVTTEVEHCAAFSFFGNICDDIEIPEPPPPPPPPPLPSGMVNTHKRRGLIRF
jgi:hypothetical protein